MKKRGISQLISIVIIIGLVFVIAVTINLFLRGFTEEKTQEIEFENTLGRECGGRTKLEMTHICKIGISDNLSITLENTGSGEIDGVTFFLKSGSDSNTTTINKTIGKFEKKTFNVPAPDYVANKELIINYVKHILIENETGDCDTETIEVEVPGENLVYNPGFEGNPPVTPPGDGWNITSAPLSGGTIVDFDGEKVYCYQPGAPSSVCAIKQVVPLNPDREYNIGSKVYVENPTNPGDAAAYYRITVRFDNNGDGIYNETTEYSVDHPYVVPDYQLVGVWQDLYISVDPNIKYVKRFIFNGTVYEQDCDPVSAGVFDPDCNVKKEVGYQVYDVVVEYGVDTTYFAGNDLIVWFDDAEV
ncbi:MAG: hypothetical protein ACFFG0_47140, partial [Candidatus Thorarchaeota archaeon]